jgi:hypothetical protein
MRYLQPVADYQQVGAIASKVPSLVILRKRKIPDSFKNQGFMVVVGVGFEPTIPRRDYEPR